MYNMTLSWLGLWVVVVACVVRMKMITNTRNAYNKDSGVAMWNENLMN